jgi:hypothetical protein
MRHVLRPGRLPHDRLAIRRASLRRNGTGERPPRLSDLILALVGVTLLGGFALSAALALTS